jgi:hypothetical protein
MSKGFRVSGHAIGAAGEISKPFSEFIEVQASSVLPQIGGHGSARSVAFRHGEYLKFDLAHTEVTGAPCDCPDEEPLSSIRVTSTIEGLNIMGMVTADSVVATVFTSCKIRELPTFKLIGTHFDNLKIAGIPVDVPLALDVFDRYDTYSSLAEAYKTDTDIQNIFNRGALRQAPSHVLSYFHLPEGGDLPVSNGIASASLVRAIVPKSAGLEHWGHVIHVSGFGTIRLAEVGIGKDVRTVSMVQVQVDCPVKARFSCCEVSAGCDGGN